MLALTRKKDQKIIIGDDIEIVILEIKDDKVKLGIKAPRQVAVHRLEVYQSILEENRLAATLGKQDQLLVLLEALELKKDEKG